MGLTYSKSLKILLKKKKNNLKKIKKKILEFSSSTQHNKTAVYSNFRVQPEPRTTLCYKKYAVNLYIYMLHDVYILILNASRNDAVAAY